MNIKKLKRIYISITILLFLTAYFVGCTGTGTYIPSTNADWVLRWSDEFHGPNLNPVYWTRVVAAPETYNTNEYQRYVDGFTNSFITNLGDGMLVLKAIHTGVGLGKGDFTSARLSTEGSLDWKYGKIMARIKMPTGGKGMWPAFWMLGVNNDEGGFGDVPWPQCGEIDILEMIGSEPTNAYANLFWYVDTGSTNSSDTNHLRVITNTNALSEDFHIYEIEWDETKIVWRFDNVQFKEHDITGPDMLEFHQNFFITLNIAVGGPWDGVPTAQIQFPQYMFVDWIRVYQRVSP